MASIAETAMRFFAACEEGKGWDECKNYCTADATFSAQAEPLADVHTLEQYTEWMKGLLTFLSDTGYELKSFAIDDERKSVCAYAVLPTTLVPALVYSVSFIGDASATVFPSPLWYTVVDRVLVALMLAGIGLWVWTLLSIALAYRHYIRMKHAPWVAVASQMIALASAAIAYAWRVRLIR